MNEPEFARQFCEQLLNKAKHKFELYDGIKSAGRGAGMNTDFFLRYAIEELGEIASALTRERFALAREECIDLAHCAMLIALAIKEG